MCTTTATELAQLNPVRIIALVLDSRIVALLALWTLERNDYCPTLSCHDSASTQIRPGRAGPSSSYQTSAYSSKPLPSPPAQCSPRAPHPGPGNKPDTKGLSVHSPADGRHGYCPDLDCHPATPTSGPSLQGCCNGSNRGGDLLVLRK